MLDFTISGIESITRDFEAFTPRINRAVSAGLNAVSSDMSASLKKHIELDVYAAYDPKDYLRRSDNPSYGTPLNSDENIGATVVDNTLIFGYVPTGEHSLYDEEIDNDELIRVISLAEGYQWFVKKRKIPPRPFWDNFLAEMIYGKQAEISFVEGMNNADKDLNVIQTGQIVADGNETTF